LASNKPGILKDAFKRVDISKGIHALVIKLSLAREGNASLTHLNPSRTHLNNGTSAYRF
jgi:hypothetical protein